MVTKMSEYERPDEGLIEEAATGERAQREAAVEALSFDMYNVELVCRALKGVCDGVGLDMGDIMDAASEGTEEAASVARKQKAVWRDVVGLVDTFAHMAANEKGPEGDPDYARTYGYTVRDVIDDVEALSPTAAEELRAGVNCKRDYAGLEPLDWS